jgi:hypothetical protein
VNEKLLNKIKALLAKANCKSVTEEEGKAFLTKAQELMTRHGIELADLPEDAVDRAIEIQGEKASYGRKREYDVACGSVLKRCFGIDVLHAGSTRHVFTLIGTAEDIAIAKELLPMLRVTMGRGFIRWQKEKGITRWSSNEARAYYWGLAKGYIEASEEGKRFALQHASKAQQDNYGLILANKAEAVSLYVKKAFPNLKHFSETCSSAHGAMADGYVQGSTLKLVQPKQLKP